MASSSVSSVSVRIRILDRHIIINDNNDDDDKSSKSSRTTKRNHVKKRGGRRYIRDENATVYISISSSSSSSSNYSSSLYDILRIKKDESLIVGDDDVIVCQLIRSIVTAEANNGYRSLSTPVIVRKLASLPITNNESSNALPTDTSNSSSDEAGDGTTTTTTKPPLLYIPPCLAATLGLMLIHNTTNTNSNTSIMGGGVCYLRPYQKCEKIIHFASHVTVRELGILPPLPIVKYPITMSNLDNNNDNNNNVNDDDDGGRRVVAAAVEDMEKENKKDDIKEEGEERELKYYFFHKVQKGQQQSQKSDNDNNDSVANNSSSGRYKPRQRLLTLGSIFAVPSSVHSSNNMNENNAEKMLLGNDDDDVQNVRFYQIVNVQCTTNSSIQKNETTSDGSTILEIPKDGQQQQQQQQRQRLAYIISPSTQLVLLSCTTTTTTTIDPINTMYDNSLVPKLNGYTVRLPCITTTISFLRSIAKMTKYNAHDLTRTDIATTTAAAATASHNSHNHHNHPSVNDVIDALYLQSAIPSMKNSSLYNIGSITQDHTRIINIVGKEENHLCHCIDEACNIMGMRSFHVDGLAAFWAQHNVFDAYNQRHHVISNTSSLPTTLSSQTLTGALPDKLRGIVVALDIALRSSPCVLHIAGIDRELSSIGSGGGGQSVDPDVRVEEERRILEVIRTVIGRDSSTNVVFQHNSSASDVAPRGDGGGRATCDTLLTNLLTPRIIIILSSTIPLPQGPLTSSFLQRSIVISPPDTNYARVLWDDNIDGTFDSLSSYLNGMSANEIVYMRQKFVHRWKKKEEEKNKEEFSPVSLLQSILADLEVMRSFTRSSRRGGGGGGGGGSNLPLSSTSLPNVRWEDVGGLETIRKEIMDAVELPLKYPTLFEGSRRSGILLFGPPGTGKTLVAKAVARECGLPFLSVKGPELLGSYVGESEANIRSVFEAARLAAMNPPSSSSFDGAGSGYSGASVLFFDEFDSLAPRRGETGHGDGVMDRVVATLLSELDGASSAGISSSSKGQSTTPLVHVIVIAATNRPDLLDPSLLRPGRLDRLLYLGPAKSKEHCLKILLAQTRKFRFQDGCDAATVLEQAMDSFPPTLSGADLSAVASGALMRGLKRVCDTIEEEARNLNDKKNIGSGSGGPALDVDDVMDSWSKDRLQPTLIAEDFIEAAKDIVPSISSTDLQHFENLQRQYSSC